MLKTYKMKKLIFSILCACSMVGASALTVSQPVKINTDGPAHNPSLSPDGTTLLFSSDNHTGLKMLRLGESEIITLDDAPGAGFCPVFSTDGKAVIYQTAQMCDGLLNRDIRSYSLESGKIKELSPMSRQDINLLEVSGADNYVYADIEKINIKNNGSTTSIQPVIDAHSYLWASLSPDCSQLVFVEPFQGVFVCDLNGNNLRKIASKGAFPSWASNNLITFIVSHDDGYVILDSVLKIYDLDTDITLDLTSDEMKIGESSSAANGSVIYSTLEGDVYQITVK